jgi:hypothetical protein
LKNEKKKGIIGRARIDMNARRVLLIFKKSSFMRADE